jgi:hypothetical protein
LGHLKIDNAREKIRVSGSVQQIRLAFPTLEDSRENQKAHERALSLSFACFFNSPNVELDH